MRFKVKVKVRVVLKELKLKKLKVIKEVRVPVEMIVEKIIEVPVEVIKEIKVPPPPPPEPEPDPEPDPEPEPEEEEEEEEEIDKPKKKGRRRTSPPFTIVKPQGGPKARIAGGFKVFDNTGAPNLDLLHGNFRASRGLGGKYSASVNPY